jgi:D-alanyl-D-alanine carboxypeptidase (penicillin-binding protein 5/6)
VIPDPIYLALKLKRKLKGWLYTLRYRNNISREGIKEFLADPNISKDQLKRLGLASLRPMRVVAVSAVFVLLLSFGAGSETSSAGAVGGASAVELTSVSRPAPLAGVGAAPKLTAKTAYLVDPKTGFVFYDKHSSRKRPAASTVKLATAIVALDNFDLDEVVRVRLSCVNRAGESLIKLLSGEKLTVRNLIKGMLVASGSDAACALASHYRGGSAEFISEMNKLSESLGLDRTRFDSFSGLSAGSYSTAQELVLLAKEALSRPVIKKTVRIRKSVISSTDKEHWHELVNTNELLGRVDGVLGVKTGYTLKAGEVLVFYLKRGEKEILGSVMGSKDRFRDAQKLLNWALSSFLFP